MRTAILLICTVLAATSLAATRTPYSYHEDFTTWEFRDDLATTADWDHRHRVAPSDGRAEPGRRHLELAGQRCRRGGGR